MTPEFKKCLEDKKIITFARGRNLFRKEVSVARSDLFDAKAGYESGRYKWSTIQAYYALIHCINFKNCQESAAEPIHV